MPEQILHRLRNKEMAFYKKTIQTAKFRTRIIPGQLKHFAQNIRFKQQLLHRISCKKFTIHIHWATVLLDSSTAAQLQQ